MEKRSVAAHLRDFAPSKRSNDDEESNQTQASEPVSKKSVGLHLEEPALPQCEHKPEETDTGSEMAGSPVSVSSSRSGRSNSRLHKQPESIYDYLDTLETQSELQLQSASGPGSTSSSARSRRMLPSHSRDYAWENDANDFAPRSISGGSPAPSYRSGASRANSDVSHHYLVGIKEKLATMTIELNDKTKTIELLKMARKKDKVKTKQLLQAEEVKRQAQLKEQQLKLDKELEQHLDFAQNLVTDKKTEEVEKSTIKALEPDIQAILQKGKADLDKAQDAAADEQRKLQTHLEKQHEAALQQQKDDYERKLVDAREKERAKLMTRLDAADTELQLQLSNQRRRLQEETEIARNELYSELRASKLAQAKELDELKAQETKRMETALTKCQKEKEDVDRKYEALQRRQARELLRFVAHASAARRAPAARDHGQAARAPLRGHAAGQRAQSPADERREKMETMAENFQTQKIQNDHDAELANLHERVRSTIARKDQVIENAQEELHLIHVKLSKSHALIEEQRMQLFEE